MIHYDFDLYANSNFTFITYRQKGLLPALQDLFPAAKHRYCVRHIHDNMNLIYKGGNYKELLWKCATATTVVAFERAIDEFKGYNRMAHNWLRKILLSIRAEPTFQVFNRQLLDARDSHVITALEYVREYFMKRVVIVQKMIEKSQGPLTPTVTEIFNAIKEKASQLTVVWNGAEPYQVNDVACIFNMTDNGIEAGFLENWVHQLMRKDGTVTCCNYGKKGHNKRSCIGPSVAGSGAASVSQTPRQRQASTRGLASGSQPIRPSQRSVSVSQLQRQTQRHSVAASGSQATKMTPTRQSQRQKASRMTPTK
ncbi:hypothetical protein Tco_0622513 [Tanacetum coccineum]